MCCMRWPETKQSIYLSTILSIVLSPEVSWQIQQSESTNNVIIFLLGGVANHCFYLESCVLCFFLQFIMFKTLFFYFKNL